MAERINSSKKGAKAERALSKIMTDWVGVEFQRVPRSGGLRWGSGLMVTGDIIPADPVWLVRFPFSIENKVRNSVKFEDLILDQKSEIMSFWEQASEDAARINKIPMVVFRYDFMKKGVYFIVINKEVFSKIKKILSNSCEIPLKYFSVSNKLFIFASYYLFESDYLKIEEAIKI